MSRKAGQHKKNRENWRRRGPKASSWSKNPLQKQWLLLGWAAAPSENKSSRGGNWSFVVLAKSNRQSSPGLPLSLPAKETQNLSGSGDTLARLPNFHLIFQLPGSSTETSTLLPVRPQDVLVTRCPVPFQCPSVVCGLSLSCSSQNQKLLLGLELPEVFLTIFELGLKI